MRVPLQVLSCVVCFVVGCMFMSAYDRECLFRYSLPTVEQRDRLIPITASELRAWHNIKDTYVGQEKFSVDRDVEEAAALYPDNQLYFYSKKYIPMHDVEYYTKEETDEGKILVYVKKLGS